MGAQMKACGGKRLAIITGLAGAGIAALVVGLAMHFGRPACETCEIPTTTTPQLPTARTSENPTTTTAQPTTALPQPNEPIRGLRLPTAWAPSHYDVILYPDIYTGDPATFEFEGWVKIHITCVEATNNITLHIRKLTIQEDTIKVEREGNTVDVTTSQDVPREFYIIHLDQETTQTQSYTVQMNFTGMLKKDLDGMYYSDYIEDGQYKYMVATQFEATDARKAFPCMDEPQYRATFTVSLGHKAGFTPLSNMPPRSTEASYKPDWQITHFDETSKTMPTYLVAFAVSQYASVSTTKNITHWSTPEFVAKGFLQRSISLAPVMFDAFETLFNFPYPFPKQDQITVNDFGAGAMENWGLITYIERGLAWDPDHLNLRELEWMSTVIAHELLHMWLGNVVTCKWWSHIWLQESMARFYQYHVMEYSSTWDKEKLFQHYAIWRAFDYDQSGRTHPLYNPVETPGEIMSMFSRVSYDKGGCMIRMTQYLILGETAFDEAMVEYISRNAYSSVVYDDLVNVWADFSGRPYGPTLPATLNVTAAWHTWILQMGYPLVTVGRQGNTITFTQTHYRLDPNKPIIEKYPSPFGYKWDIPVSWVQQLTPTAPTTTWLQRQDVDNIAINTESDWVIANYLQRGFYRVNYDSTLWEAIINQLNDDHTVVDTLNRAQLLDDAFTISRSGELTGVTAFRLTRHLESETAEYNPWAALNRHVPFLNGLLRTDADFHYLQTYMQKIVSPVYDDINWEITWDPDNHLFDGHRWRTAVDVACRYELPACRAMADSSFFKWMAEPDNYQHIRPDIRESVYCSAIRWDADGTRWRFLYDLYDNQTEFGGSGERNRRRNALACSQDLSALTNILTMANSTNTYAWMVEVARNPAGTGLTWDYLDENWDHTVSRKLTVLSVVGQSFSTQADLEKMQAFRARHVEKDTVERGLYDDIEYLIKANILWRDRNAQQVFNWLKAEVEPGAPVRPDLYLPQTWTPTHYDVTLMPDIYTGNPSNFSFTGSVEMSLTCEISTNKITFHFRKMNINENTVIVKVGGQSVPIVSEVIEAEKEFYVITTQQTFNVGDLVTVSANFNGSLTKDMIGMYYSDWQDANDVEQYMVATQFEPLDARKAFPCLDEPRWKASFRISLGHKTGFTPLSNMPAEPNPDDLGDGWWLTHFNTTTVDMPTYLISVAVSQFESISTFTPGGLTSKHLTHWTRPEYIHRGIVNDSLLVAAEEFDFLEELFNYSYSLPKEDQITVDDFRAGAMENWGLITYLERGLAWDPLHSDLAEYEWMVTVLAHELLHQWLGNLVTCEWWSHLWLQEGMATHYQFPTQQSVRPKWDQDELHQLRALWSALDNDALGTLHPLYNPDVQTEAEIRGMFSRITYQKGGSFIRMVKHLILGEESYNTAMRNYVRIMAHSVAVYDDLFDAWTNQAAVSNVSTPENTDIKEVFSTWVTQMGYPLVTISRQGDTLTLEQSHFLINPSVPIQEKYPSQYSYTWHIPVTLVEQSTSDQNETYWLERNNRTGIAINSGSNWVYANIRARGVYRVNYDDTLWDTIIQQLNSNPTEIDSVTRAQMLDDSFMLSRSDQLSATVFMRLTEHLANETTYYTPWAAVQRALHYMDPILDLDMDYDRLFRPYMRSLVEELYTTKEDTWTGWTDDDILQGFLGQKAVDVACKYKLPACIHTVNTLFTEWKDNSEDSSMYVQPDIRSAVYCTAIMEDVTSENFNFLFNEFVNFTHFSKEKNKRGAALACTRDPALLFKLLQLSNDTRDSNMMNAVATTSIGRLVAWDFLDRNWDNMYGRSGLLGVITGSFSTEADLQKFEEFRYRHPATSDSVL